MREQRAASVRPADIKNGRKGCGNQIELGADYFEKFDSLLNSGTSGPRWLSDNLIARIVAEAIHYRDGKNYDLIAFTVMPNHVHLIAKVDGWEQPNAGDLSCSRTPLTKTLESLKWYTALKCNAALRRRGAFWQHESYDHVIRDAAEFERCVWYVLNNPVKAGIADAWQNWRWTYIRAGVIQNVSAGGLTT